MKLKQNRHWQATFKTDIIFSPKIFQNLSKSKILNFMIKVNPNSENVTKSVIFLWDIFKSDVIFFLSKNIEVFQCFSKSNFLSFMTNSEPKEWKWNKTRHFFHGIYSNLTFFIGHKLLTFFSDFNNWEFSITLQNCAQTSKMK